MANVAWAIPVMIFPSVSTALPAKFTRRGTTADDAEEVGCCWAFTNEQKIEAPIQAASRRRRNLITTPQIAKLPVSTGIHQDSAKGGATIAIQAATRLPQAGEN